MVRYLNAVIVVLVIFIANTVIDFTLVDANNKPRGTFGCMKEILRSDLIVSDLVADAAVYIVVYIIF